MVRSTTKTSPRHFCLQFFESKKVLFLLTFKWIKHAYSTINSSIKNAVWLLTIDFSTLNGSHYLSNVIAHQRLHNESCVIGLEGIFFDFFKLKLHFYIDRQLLQDILLTYKLPYLSPPAKTPASPSIRQLLTENLSIKSCPMRSKHLFLGLCFIKEKDQNT